MTSLYVQFMATVLAVMSFPAQAFAQQVRAVPNVVCDTARVVYCPGPDVAMVMHAGTVMWIRETTTGIRPDTAVALVRGDSAWLLVAGSRIPLNATRSAMLRRAIASAKQALHLDSVHSRAHPE